jgi:hypothetical protein
MLDLEWLLHNILRLFQFRIAILLSRHSAPIVSEPSVVISTLPSGVPSTAPTILRATAIDSSRISVSWEPRAFPNGPVLSYVLQINELPQGYSALKVTERGPYHACVQLPVSVKKTIRLSVYYFIIPFLLVQEPVIKFTKHISISVSLDI